MDVNTPGSTPRKTKNGLHLYPVSPGDSGEGLPYAPEDWPNPGDKWRWKTGKRVTGAGYIWDRHLYLPRHLVKAGQPKYFRSKSSVKKHIQSAFPGADVNGFFASFSWHIPSKQFNSNELLGVDSQFAPISCKADNNMCISLPGVCDPPTEPMFCDICCSEPGFCRNCCCILCSKAVCSAFGGYSYIRCKAMFDGYICGHVAHMACAHQACLAGTVGGTFGLDAEYLCRRCDSRTDLVSHILEVLQTCKSIDSRDEIEKTLNLAISLLHGSRKMNARWLLNHIESISAKLKNGANFGDVWKKEDAAIEGITARPPPRSEPKPRKPHSKKSTEMDFSRLAGSKKKQEVPKVTVAVAPPVPKPITKQTTLRIVNFGTKRSEGPPTAEVVVNVADEAVTTDALALDRNKRKVGAGGLSTEADDSQRKKRVKSSGVALTNLSLEVFGKSPHRLVEDQLLSKIPRSYWEGKSLEDVKDQALFYQALGTASACKALQMEENAKAKLTTDLNSAQSQYELAKKHFEDTKALLDVSRQRVLDLEAAARTHAQTASDLCEAQQQVGIARSLGIEFKSTVDDKGVVSWTGDSEKIKLRARADFQKSHGFIEASLGYAREHISEVFDPLLAPEGGMKTVVKMFEAFPAGDQFVMSFAKDSFLKGNVFTAIEVNEALSARYGDAYDPTEWGMLEDCVVAWADRATEEVPVTEEQPAAEKEAAEKEVAGKVA